MNKAQEILSNLMYEYPNDFVVIAKNSFGDCFISEVFTYKEDAYRQHKRFMDKLDINFKVSIHQLNNDSIKLSEI